MGGVFTSTFPPSTSKSFTAVNLCQCEKKKKGTLTKDCRLSAKYNFEKPNDRRALDLMNAAAVAVVRDLPDVMIGYGVSDEFRYVFSFLSWYGCLEKELMELT